MRSYILQVELSRNLLSTNYMYFYRQGRGIDYVKFLILITCVASAPFCQISLIGKASFLQFKVSVCLKLMNMQRWHAALTLSLPESTRKLSHHFVMIGQTSV